MKIAKLLQVLAENDDYLVLDKPAGLLVVRDRWDKTQETLHDLVQGYLKGKAWPVHRLDKEASGLVAFAKNAKTRTFLEKQFQQSAVEKLYWVLTEGEMEEDTGTVHLGISEEPQHPGKMRVGGKNAKPSLTHFEVLERFKGLTYAKVRPESGRQHQIRVHFQSLGYPIVCDSIYGSSRAYYLSQMKRFYKQKNDQPEKPLMNRLALHAYQLTFLDARGESQTIVSPLPKDFTVFLKYLRKFWGVG